LVALEGNLRSGILKLGNEKLGILTSVFDGKTLRRCLGSLDFRDVFWEVPKCPRVSVGVFGGFGGGGLGD